MKLHRILFAAGLALAALNALRAEEETPARYRGWEWLSQYYQNPRPDDLVSAVYSLSRSGYFESFGQPAVAMGFFAGVFETNPHQVNYWLHETKELPARHRRVIAAAAWLAGHPAGMQLLRELSTEIDDAGLRAELGDLLAHAPTVLAATPVQTPSSMNLQWGAFLATGNERHIVNILAALGSGEPSLATSARFALAQHAAAHPRVMEICQAQLSRQPEAVRSEIRAALKDAARTPGT